MSDLAGAGIAVVEVEGRRILAAWDGGQFRDGSALGASMDDVVKTTAHLQHLKRDFAEYNEAYATFFTEPYPVRTTVGSDLYDILVEIDVVVALPQA